MVDFNNLKKSNIPVGLNNLLKRWQTQFRGQNYDQLALNLGKCLRDQFPNATIFAMLPLCPPKFNSQRDDIKALGELNDAVGKNKHLYFSALYFS